MAPHTIIIFSMMQNGNAQIDSYNCIESLNETVLDFFNRYLAGR